MVLWEVARLVERVKQSGVLDIGLKDDGLLVFIDTIKNKMMPTGFGKIDKISAMPGMPVKYNNDVYISLSGKPLSPDFDKLDIDLIDKKGFAELAPESSNESGPALSRYTSTLNKYISELISAFDKKEAEIINQTR